MSDFLTTSRYRSSLIVYDDGNIRANRLLPIVLDYTPMRYVDRDDNQKYITQYGDSFEGLAVDFYGDPLLWWVIPDFQPIPIIETLVLDPGLELIIPTYDMVRKILLFRG